MRFLLYNLKVNLNIGGYILKLCKKIITYLLTIVAGLLIYTGLSTTSVAADSSSTQPPVQDDNNKSSNSSTDANSDNTDTNKSGQTDQNGTDNQDNTKPKPKPKQVVTGFAMMTKVAGNKNYKVWKEVKDGKVSTKVADGINFQYSHIMLMVVK